MKARRNTIRKLYREAIFKIFGFEDDPDMSEENEYLLKAISQDVHYGDEAPGQWSSSSLLEIYCENGIPNATDEFDPSFFGFPGKVTYNSDQWRLVDDYVNLYFKSLGLSDRFHHEPFNSAVVNVYRS